MTDTPQASTEKYSPANECEDNPYFSEGSRIIAKNKSVNGRHDKARVIIAYEPVRAIGTGK